MKRYSAFFLFVLLLALPAYARQSDPLASLEPVQGLVQIQTAEGAWETVTETILVAEGDIIRTSGDGLAYLTFFDGAETEIGPSTLVVVSTLDLPDDGTVDITLDVLVGTTLTNIDVALDASDRFEIHTPGATAVVRGTRWLTVVAPDGSASFFTERGQVQILPHIRRHVVVDNAVQATGGVDALERDDYGALPGPVFVRGFTRNYARLLGVDAEPLMRSVEATLSPRKADGAAEPSPLPRPGLAAVLPNADAATTNARRRRLLYVVAAVIILVSAYVATRDRTPAPAPIDVPVGMTPTEAPVTPPASVPLTVSEAPQAPASVAPVSSETVPPRPAAVTSPAPERETSTGITGPELRFTFSGESWVEVRNGKGALIFGQVNPEGSVRIVRGTPPLSLVVGNASGVSLTFRGKPVDLEPHTRTGVARLTLE